MIGLAFGQGIRRALGRSSGVRLGRGVCPGHPFRPALALGFRTTFGRAGRPIGADGARVPCRRRALRLIRPLGHGSLLDPFACRFRTGSAVARLRDEWQADYARRRRRDLSARRYVYLWADGVYLQARMEPQAECMPVLIGATPEGRKELVGFQVGLRESAQSWRELLADLKARGLAIAPELATGDGALGFWKALEAVSPATRHQRCWVHETANVLDKLPKSIQPAAKQDLREIWQAPDRATAEAAIATFAEKYAAKYEEATTCLTKDREALLAFYDFPAEHRDHSRTSNPIESVFATVRHRTVRTKGALSQDTARLMVFKPVMAAAKAWRRLKGENQLPKLIRGVTFKNGVEVSSTPAQHAA